MTGREKLIEEIERRISSYENSAEECIQELDNEELGNNYLFRANELKDLLRFINEEI